MSNVTFAGSGSVEYVAVNPATNLVYFVGPGNDVTVVGGYGSTLPPKTVTVGLGGGLWQDLNEAVPVTIVALVAAVTYLVLAARQKRLRPEVSLGTELENQEPA
jgi:hypothetical protein